MKARYAGLCDLCGDKWKSGDEITKDGVAGYAHAECWREEHGYGRPEVGGSNGATADRVRNQYARLADIQKREGDYAAVRRGMRAARGDA